MFQKLISNIIGQRSEQREAELYRNLIRHEAKIGGEVFGGISRTSPRVFCTRQPHLGLA